MIKNEYKKIDMVIKNINEKNKNIKNLLKGNDDELILKELYSMQILSEKYVNMCRKLPLVYSPSYVRKQIMDNSIKYQGVEVAYQNNIVISKIPFMLNKKESGNSEYISNTLRYALEEYFKNKEYTQTEEETIIIFKHCYKKGYKSYRDHDNIEVNKLIDVMVGFFLKDDSPTMLSHFYFSEFEHNSNYCVIYLVPKTQFKNFLEENF